MPYRNEVLRTLTRVLPGANLYDLAQQYHVTISRDGRRNKGWVGQTVECAADLRMGTLPLPDGDDFELKTTLLIANQGDWEPKETIRVTQLNPRAILEEEFETSALWRKLQRLILVGYFNESDSVCRVVRIGGVDITQPEIVNEIKAFWEEVRYSVVSGDIVNYFNQGKSVDLIQLRPTGTGKQLSTCPITGEKFPARAFYATKRLIRRLLSL